MLRSPILIGLIGLAAATSACTPEPHMVPIACRAIPTAGQLGVDTLSLWIHLEQHATRRPTRLLVRVDSLSEPGAVQFSAGAPPTAAAASMALTSSAVFQGCVGDAPSAFHFASTEAPIGRVWVRVSANTPVVTALTVGDESPDDPNAGLRVTVLPGQSGSVVRRAGSTGP